MEFEELQKVWDTQNTRQLYVFDEKALHKRIVAKKNRASYTANLTEWLVIVTNIFSGVIILSMNIFNGKGNAWMFVLSLWMFGIAGYVIVSRYRRLRGHDQYDRSMRGDLVYALDVASYQVQLSKWVRWGLVPIGVLILFGMLQGGKSIWFATATLVFFAISYYFSGWEHNYYKSKKRELEVLYTKLEGE